MPLALQLERHRNEDGEEMVRQRNSCGRIHQEFGSSPQKKASERGAAGRKVRNFKSGNSEGFDDNTEPLFSIIFLDTESSGLGWLMK